MQSRQIQIISEQEMMKGSSCLGVRSIMNVDSNDAGFVLYCLAGVRSSPIVSQ